MTPASNYTDGVSERRLTCVNEINNSLASVGTFGRKLPCSLQTEQVSSFETVSVQLIRTPGGVLHLAGVQEILTNHQRFAYLVWP